MEFIIKSQDELKNVAQELFKSVLLKMALEERTGKKYNATVIGLCGDLGSGKTTFTKYFAKQFGILAKDIISPTFIIQKKFRIIKKERIEKNKQPLPFKNFYHLDVYRIENSNEILKLKWQETLDNSENIILVEWANKIEDILPVDTIKMYFESIDENTRKIKIEIK